jgi:hypothetical protein
MSVLRGKKFGRVNIWLFGSVFNGVLTILLFFNLSFSYKESERQLNCCRFIVIPCCACFSFGLFAKQRGVLHACNLGIFMSDQLLSILLEPTIKEMRAKHIFIVSSDICRGATFED